MRLSPFFLVGGVGPVVLAQLDPIVNFCRRIDTQCMSQWRATQYRRLNLTFGVKETAANKHPATLIDNTIYIDGGRAVFTTYDDTGKDIGPRIQGNSIYPRSSIAW